MNLKNNIRFFQQMSKYGISISDDEPKSPYLIKYNVNKDNFTCNINTNNFLLTCFIHIAIQNIISNK